MVRHPEREPNVIPESIVLRTKQFRIFIHIHRSDRRELLLEGNRRVSLGGRYTARKDAPHLPPPRGDYHLHVYDGPTPLLAINRNGTAHDASHGIRIPNEVRRGIERLFPDWTLPADGIIECVADLKLQTILDVLVEDVVAEYADRGLIAEHALLDQSDGELLFESDA